MTPRKAIAPFDPSGKVRHYATIHVARDRDEAMALMEGWEAIDEEKDMRGACACYHDEDDQTGDLKAIIVIIEEHLTVPVLAHECAHAAVAWVQAVSMPEAARTIADPDALDSYYHEAVATAVESLVAAGMALVPRE